MCCFFTSLFLIGPRFAFLVFLLFPYGQMKSAMAFHTVIWPLLGFLFLPWTLLMYVIVYPVYGFLWFWVIIGLMADIATYASGVYQRHQVSYYTGP